MYVVLEMGSGVGEREVWSWGAGTHGQLGCGTLVDALTPQRVAALSDAGNVVDMACGGAHAVAVFDDGDVATWGRGQAGVLGHGDETTTTVPRVVSSLQGIRVRRVAAGWNHSAFVTDNGELYTCGDGTFGQLGHGHTESRLLPSLVEHLSSLSITDVACGMRHTLALAITEGSTSASVVYAFGFNKRGQLGIQTNTTGRGSNEIWRVPSPRRVNFLDTHGVVTICANGDHSTALTRSGEMFLWGRGYNDALDSCQPHLALVGVKVSQVSLGWSHGLALTENEEVYAWGNNRCGQLGVSRGCDPSKVDQGSNMASKSNDLALGNAEEKRCVRAGNFGRVLNQTYVDFQKVETRGLRTMWISAGSEHSAGVLDDGSVIMWGWAEHGQLGLGSRQDQETPHIVLFPGQRPSSEIYGKIQVQTTKESDLRTRIYCGSGFTFVVF